MRWREKLKKTRCYQRRQSATRELKSTPILSKDNEDIDNEDGDDNELSLFIKNARRMFHSYLVGKIRSKISLSERKL